MDERSGRRSNAAGVIIVSLLAFATATGLLCPDLLGPAFYRESISTDGAGMLAPISISSMSDEALD